MSAPANLNFKQEFDKFLSAASHIVVTAHKRPDHDAVTASLAMYNYIKQIFPDIQLTVGFESETNPGFDYLPDFDKLVWVDDLRQLTQSADLIILLDGNSLSRFTEFSAELRAQPNLKFICIDHHRSEGEDFDLQLIDVTAAAVCQVLAEAVFTTDSLITQPIATQLLEGIMGDTGGLTYIRKSNAHVLDQVRRLIEMGDQDLEAIRRRFNRIRLATFPVFQELIKNTRNVDLGNNIPPLTYSYLDKEFIESLPDKSLAGDGHYRFSILKSIENHPWGFVMRYNPDQPDIFSISFRSTVGAPNVRLLCEEFFQGGGNDKTAGGTYKLQPGEESWTAKEVAARILEIIATAKIEIVAS